MQHMQEKWFSLCVKAFTFSTQTRVKLLLISLLFLVWLFAGGAPSDGNGS